MSEFYGQNRAYADLLESFAIDGYEKYVKWLASEKGGRVLDVGCGVGQVVDHLCSSGRDGYGADISELFVKQAGRTRRGRYSVSAECLPFRDESFDAVGSYTVLEHTEQPELLIQEMCRVLAPTGRLVLACPNFLGISNSYHWHTRGCARKVRNILCLMEKWMLARTLTDRMGFDSMAPVRNGSFNSDDDAIAVTNPIDVEFFLRQGGIKVGYLSSVISAGSAFSTIRDLPFIRCFMGGVFAVGVKE